MSSTGQRAARLARTRSSGRDLAEGAEEDSDVDADYADPMTTEQVVHYRDLSAEYLRKAKLHLAEDDLTQASEKGWGAAAEAVKAAAQERGWRHEGHRDLWQTLRALVEERGDTELRLDFTHAQSLHVNFYEAAMNREEVEEYLQHVERLVGKLHSLV